MSRYFSSTARSFIRWLGFPKESLTDGFKEAVEFYSENGARKKVGEIESIEILHRNDGSSPIHQSHYNRNDREYIISARITPADGPDPRLTIYTRMEQEPLEWVTSESTRLTESSL